MPSQDLRCPFCGTSSARGTGLTAHIRGRHPKQYTKWIKDPNRLDAARTLASAKEPANKLAAAPGSDSAHEKPRQAQAAARDQSVLDLLRKAQSHLANRKKILEEEVARFDLVRKELETVNAQIESLEHTLGVF